MPDPPCKEVSPMKVALLKAVLRQYYQRVVNVTFYKAACFLLAKFSLLL